MTPVFGEFLAAASEHITAAASLGGALSDDAKRGVICELDRLVTTLARYLDDIAQPADLDSADKDPLNPGTWAALDARLALRRAARSLHPAAQAVQESRVDDTHPAVRHLSSATDQLTAGRDLLQTHFTSGPADAPTGNSYWATVITSRPVTAALLSEIAACSLHLAFWSAQLYRTGPRYSGVPATARQALRTASRWLGTAGTTVQAAQRQHPPPPEGRRLLTAIPPNIPPPRWPPGDTEPVPELCEGVTVTAERLRHAAPASAPQARWSPAANSLSWRRDALASAITGHSTELILRTLAERARHLGLHPALHAQIQSAADTLSQTWPTWRAIAHQWDIFTTGIHHGRQITPVAAEFGDLVLRTGRLAYRNPHWTPACAAASLPREPADLASTASDIRTVLSAVHYAIDAVGRITTEDAQAVRTAAADHRLYMPTRLLPERHDIPGRYSPAPPPQASELLAAYRTAIDASLRSAIVLDGLAVTFDAPGSVLATARTWATRPETASQPAEDDGANGRPQTGEPLHPPPLQAGQTERILRSHQITEPAMLLRAAAIDEAARDLVEHATANARKRDSLKHLPLRRTRETPGRAARTAARDLPPPPGPDQPADPAPGLPVGEPSPSRRIPPALRNSPIRGLTN